MTVAANTMGLITRSECCNELSQGARLYLQHGRLIGNPDRLEVLIRVEAVMVSIGMEGVKQFLPCVFSSDVVNHKLCLRDILHTPGWLHSDQTCIFGLWLLIKCSQALYLYSTTQEADGSSDRQKEQCRCHLCFKYSVRLLHCRLKEANRRRVLERH